MTTLGPRDLSPRQREILALVAAGRTSKEIASELGISESTVNWHLANAFERLGASSRAEAVALALREETDQSNGERAKAEHAVPRQSVDRSTLPVSSIALAFALTLLVGLISGALIAGWNLSSPTPTPSAAPSGLSSPPATPTARPTGGRAPESPSDLAAPPPTGTAAPAASEAPTLRTIAPLSSPVVVPVGIPEASPQRALEELPTLPPLPLVAPLLSVP